MHKHAVIALVTSTSCSVQTKGARLGPIDPILGMAAPSKQKQGGTGTSLMSRTLERCKYGLKLSWIGAAGAGGRRERPVAGCFPVYVGPERVRFDVRVEYASHPLFRRLLDDAEREYGHAPPCGIIALPCDDVDAYLTVLRHIKHGGDGGGDDGDGGGDDGDGGGDIPTALSSLPRGLAGLQQGPRHEDDEPEVFCSGC